MITLERGFGCTLSYESWLFPGGEVGVRLDTENHKFKGIGGSINVWARLQSSKDVIELLMVIDALKRICGKDHIYLYLPYIPYGRQDRACTDGEAFSLGVFAKLINSLNVDIITFDPHSLVTPAVFENLKVIRQDQIFQRWDDLSLYASRDVLLVAPDAGASHKVNMLAEYFEHPSYATCAKERNLRTGKLIGHKIVDGEVKGRDCLIVDDICDGGVTFTSLARALLLAGAKDVQLYVTHGIFSKGTDSLYKAGISRIWTTDSYSDALPSNVSSKVRVFNLAPAGFL